MSGWVGGRVDGWVDEWADEWMDDWVDEWTDEWTDGWMGISMETALPVALDDVQLKCATLLPPAVELHGSILHFSHVLYVCCWFVLRAEFF